MDSASTHHIKNKEVSFTALLENLHKSLCTLFTLIQHLWVCNRYLGLNFLHIITTPRNCDNNQNPVWSGLIIISSTKIKFTAPLCTLIHLLPCWWYSHPHLKLWYGLLEHQHPACFITVWLWKINHVVHVHVLLISKWATCIKWSEMNVIYCIEQTSSLLRAWGKVLLTCTSKRWRNNKNQ